MKVFKQAFLLWVGAVAIAYDEVAQALKEQQSKLNQRLNRKAA